MGRILAAALAALAGFAVMALELTAVRILAPYFGDSAYVWTNVIGVLLVALALGAWLGGRLADVDRGAARLRVLWVAGAALAALAPLVAQPIGAFLLPQELPLDSAMPALVRGSLVATLLLFVPPVLLLGCTTPLLITDLARDGRVGPASGLVGAWSTIGSLGGTFAATHVLLPTLGSRGTVWLCAGLLLAAALLLVRGGKRSAAVGAAALLLCLGGPWLLDGPRRAAPAGLELLAEVESRYQFLQVLRATPEAGPARTILKINEGLDSFHSLAIEGTAWTDGAYYDWHVAAPYLAGDGERPGDLRVLSLGAAAGTYNRLFHAVFPGSTIDAVEIDPAVVALGEEHFGGLPVGSGGHVWTDLDARVFVECSDRRYHVVLVDAYENQVYVPAHVASREFFEAVHERLEPGGVVSVNAGGLSPADPVPAALLATMRAVFGDARAFRVPYSRNLVLVARRDRPVAPARLARVEAGGRLGEVLGTMADPQLWGGAPDDAPVLVDDRPLLDTLQDRALRAADEDPRPVEVAGTQPTADVVTAMRELTAMGDHEGVLALAGTARKADAELRWLAGRSRWLLRDLRGAAVEYDLAQAAGLPDWLEPSWRADRALLDEELAVLRRAQDVATRNGWLAAGLGLVILGGWWVGERRLGRAAPA